MVLINCKINSELSWTKNWLIYGHDTYDGDNNDNNRETTFQTTSKKLYVLVVTLSTKDNVNLTKQLNEGFKRPIYRNEYSPKTETKTIDNNNNKNPTRFPLDASFQGVNRLFVLVFDNTTLANGNDGLNKVERDSHKTHLVLRVDITS